MHVVIDIPENVIEDAKSSPNYYPTYHFEKIWRAIANGTPLPKGHGRLKDVDAIIDTLGCEDRDIYVKACLEEDAPTIIEADTESEDVE